MTKCYMCLKLATDECNRCDKDICGEHSVKIDYGNDEDNKSGDVNCTNCDPESVSSWG